MTSVTDSSLMQHLDGLDPYVLIPALVHATGDEALLHDAMPYAMASGRGPNDLPADLRQRTKTLLHSALADRAAAPRPSDALLRKMVDFATGTKVPAEYVPMLLEESGVVTRTEDTAPPLPEAKFNAGAISVAIVGAGVFAIAVAIYLKRAGIPFVIYEKSDAIGGTWHDNRYPGCGVDTTSHFYVYSFALHPGWPRYFSKQPDVLAYLESCVDCFGLREHIRFGVTVEAARYDEAARQWSLTARDAGGGEIAIDATAVISCVGQLNVPSIPAIPGLEAFEGPAVHTARWQPGLSLAGKRVALLGSGASAVQVGPSIAAEVEDLLVFQRSPQWLSSRPNYHQPVKPDELWALDQVSHYINWHRLQIIWQFGDRLYPALIKAPDGRGVSDANNQLREMWADYIRSKMADRPDLLAKVLPDYPPLAKRVPVDFGWFDMLKRDNVRLVTDRIDHVEAGGVVTANGVLHPVDAIVLATGFQATRMLQTIRIEGRDGRELQDVWDGDDARAYLGITVPGFPNFFIMYGPNTNLGHGGSLMFQAECQARYIASALRHLISTEASEIECRPDVFDAYNDAVDEQLDRTVWNTPGVNNWFKNSRGRIVTNSPWSLLGYWERTRHFHPDDFLVS
jgi:4-hydroxyacetophenone monooxygenase